MVERAKQWVREMVSMCVLERECLYEREGETTLYVKKEFHL